MVGGWEERAEVSRAEQKPAELEGLQCDLGGSVVGGWEEMAEVSRAEHEQLCDTEAGLGADESEGQLLTARPR